MNVKGLIRVAFLLFAIVPVSYPAERFYSVSPLPYGFDNPGNYSQPYDAYRPYSFSRPGYYPYYPYYTIGPRDHGSKHHHHRQHREQQRGNFPLKKKP